MRLDTPLFALILAALAAAACSRTVGTVGTPGPSGDVVVVTEDESGPRKLHGIPPGHYPPPGECRVWYPGRPPGHQPPPRPCGELQGRVPRGAFILYNGGAWDLEYDWRSHERRRPGSVPRIILELTAAARRR